MKRKQKRYTSLLDVDAEIFKHKRKAKGLQAQADALEVQAKGYHQMELKAQDGATQQYWKEQAEWEKKKAVNVRKKINAINETHIPKLVRTRAALQTTPMPFINPEEGVTLEP